jgi:hypothetical protein
VPAIFAARQPSDASSNKPETHLIDETFGGENVPRETASQERIHVANEGATLSGCGVAVCASENQTRDGIVARAEDQALESSAV